MQNENHLTDEAAPTMRRFVTTFVGGTLTPEQASLQVVFDGSGARMVARGDEVEQTFPLDSDQCRTLGELLHRAASSLDVETQIKALIAETERSRDELREIRKSFEEMRERAQALGQPDPPAPPPAGPVS